MATYTELYNYRQDSRYSDWAGRVEFAISVSANQIADDPTSTEGKDAWAVDALSDPSAQRPGFEQFVLAENRTATMDQIFEASDSQIQTNVDKAVTALVPDTLPTGGGTP